jgi:hypothetical protein
MTCETARPKGGGVAIVCSPRLKPRRCQIRGCTAAARYQCDFPTAKGKTCDRYLCATHRAPQPSCEATCERTDCRLRGCMAPAEQSQGRDFCPDHAREAEQLCLDIP